MDANGLRAAFTRFFAERGHSIVPSASLIPHDPSVLFTIAGMVPFKPYFLGEEPAPWPRATSIQKCFRTPDIEIIGTDTYHCTFFEMLGNFSFGDYFKAEAIPMAWELLTEVFGLDGDRLWVTVHENDDEAEQIWIDKVGLRPERIQRMGDEDNFWAMGETGPCGPDSEIFIDKGPSTATTAGPSTAAATASSRCGTSSSCSTTATRRRLTDLPRKNIDTGAGFERILPVLQGEDSVFDTDLFLPIIDAAASVIGTGYGTDERTDVRAARPGRPRPGHDHAGRRRRAAGQRGPGLRAAPRRAPRRPGGAPARGRQAHRRRRWWRRRPTCSARRGPALVEPARPDRQRRRA